MDRELTVHLARAVARRRFHEVLGTPGARAGTHRRARQTGLRGSGSNGGGHGHRIAGYVRVNARLTSLLAIAAFAAPIVAHAALPAADPYLFKGIPFDISAQTYGGKLVAGGFKQMPNGGEPEQRFAGTLRGTNVTVVTFVPPSFRVEKTVVYFDNAPAQAVRLFGDVEQRLARDYGDPNYAEHEFLPPYKAGDAARASAAFAAHKAKFQSAWTTAPGPHGHVDAIILSIDRQSHVRLAYQTKAWGRYIDSKRGSSTSPTPLP